MKPFAQQTFYELLEIPVTATADEIRAAYARAIELYGPDSPALYGLADPSQAQALRARILEAMEILTDEDLRGEYNRSIGLQPQVPTPLEAAPTQLAMTELLTGVETVHSTHPHFAVSYIPHLPPPEYEPSQYTQLVPAGEVPAAPSSTERLAEAAQPPEAPIPNRPEGEPERRLTPSRGMAFAPDSVRVAEPLPEVPGEVSPSRYIETVDGVVRGPTPLDSAQEMAHEAAIANAEAALAQVASRVREARPEPRKAFEVAPDAEFNGEVLRQVRESRGLSLQGLAEKTRISSRHLENVEADRYDSLPTTVYLRGMLMSIARELALDPLRVAKSYLALVGGKTKSER